MRRSAKACGAARMDRSARARNRRAASRLCFKPAPEGSRASRRRRSVTKKRGGVGCSPLNGAPGKARSALLGKGRAAERTNFAACGKVSDAELARTRGARARNRRAAWRLCFKPAPEGSRASRRRRSVTKKCAGVRSRRLRPGAEQTDRRPTGAAGRLAQSEVLRCRRAAAGA